MSWGLGWMLMLFPYAHRKGCQNTYKQCVQSSWEAMVNKHTNKQEE